MLNDFKLDSKSIHRLSSKGLSMLTLKTLLDGEIELERWTLSEIDEDLIFDMENKKKWLKAINNSFIRL